MVFFDLHGVAVFYGDGDSKEEGEIIVSKEIQK